LILCTILFPPYYAIRTHAKYFNEKWLSKAGWAWLPDLNKVDQEFFKETSSTVVTNYLIRFDILGLEIFGILVMSGAVFIITKNK
jgi:hypothetical protein